ncbi:MAG: hypothetical protein DMG23_11575 [Acidobacteria bacterium]|nr:MAG: hypothetical protein DMG23_11575 [Acidobacteriota bacterium]
MPRFGKSAPIRRSARINLRVAVTVSGKYPSGKPFTEETHVLSISKYGAKMHTRLPLRVGTEIRVQPRRRAEAALFRVVWTGQEGTPRAGEVGIEYVTVSNLLGVVFPE